MSEHTPGPWVTESVSGFPVWVKGPDGILVANCAVKTRPLEEDQANARLIAAAPELLELVVSVPFYTLHPDDERGPCLCSQCEFVAKRAALAQRLIAEVAT